MVRPASGAPGPAGGASRDGDAGGGDASGGDAGGGDCPACGRHYAASVLEEAGAETLCLRDDHPPYDDPPYDHRAHDDQNGGGHDEHDETVDRNVTAPLPDVGSLFDGLAAYSRRTGGGSGDGSPPASFDGLLPDPEVAPAAVDPAGAHPGAPAGAPVEQLAGAVTLPLAGGLRRAGGALAVAAFEPGELPPGTELEHFRIEAPLGRGGMGAVYPRWTCRWSGSSP